MVVATGSSQRHVLSMAERLLDDLKAAGFVGLGAEGLESADWVLIDAGDVIVHLFRSDVRTFYDVERLWGVTAPSSEAMASAQA